MIKASNAISIEMNRTTFNEVLTDISRLVQQITCLERVEIESLAGIANMEMEINVFEAAGEPRSTTTTIPRTQTNTVFL